MEKEKEKKVVRWIFISLIILIITSLIVIPFIGNNSIEDIKEEVLFEGPPQSLVDSIYTEILLMRIEHPTIVFAQILLETGYLTSDLFISNNNMFGMKVSGSRATTSNQIVNGYKFYPNWRESLIDYALLQMAFYRNISEEEYLKRLSSSYASDPNYIKKIQNIQKTLK